MPTCWIIAGPNGAGKTTFALEYLPHVAKCFRFVNADLIAAVRNILHFVYYAILQEGANA